MGNRSIKFGENNSWITSHSYRRKVQNPSQNPQYFIRSTNLFRLSLWTLKQEARKRRVLEKIFERSFAERDPS